MKYSIHNEKTIFDDHYKMVEAQVTFDTFQGEKVTARRLAFERGDSVAILLYEEESESLLLTDQFRYPTCKHKEGWLLEIVAGSLEPNESPTACIEREVLEEIGYEIEAPELISTFYTSPGGCTERIFLFYAEVSEKNKTAQGGGLEEENEDIQLVRLAISDIAQEIPKLKDAKTILAIQWFLIHQLKQL